MAEQGEARSPQEIVRGFIDKLPILGTAPNGRRVRVGALHMAHDWWGPSISGLNARNWWSSVPGMSGGLLVATVLDHEQIGGGQDEVGRVEAMVHFPKEFDYDYRCVTAVPYIYSGIRPVLPAEELGGRPILKGPGAEPDPTWAWRELPEIVERSELQPIGKRVLALAMTVLVLERHDLPVLAASRPSTT